MDTPTLTAEEIERRLAEIEADLASPIPPEHREAYGYETMRWRADIAHTNIHWLIGAVRALLEERGAAVALLAKSNAALIYAPSGASQPAQDVADLADLVGCLRGLALLGIADPPAYRSAADALERLSAELAAAEESADWAKLRQVEMQGDLAKLEEQLAAATQRATSAEAQRDEAIRDLRSVTAERAAMEERAEAAEAEIAQTRAILADPVAVYVNVLRGGIAKPLEWVRAEERATAAEDRCRDLLAREDAVQRLSYDAGETAAYDLLNGKLAAAEDRVKALEEAGKLAVKAIDAVIAARPQTDSAPTNIGLASVSSALKIALSTPAAAPEPPSTTQPAAAVPQEHSDVWFPRLTKGDEVAAGLIETLWAESGKMVPRELAVRLAEALAVCLGTSSHGQGMKFSDRLLHGRKALDAARAAGLLEGGGHGQ